MWSTAVRLPYQTGEKLEKSAQPVSTPGAAAAGDEFQAASAGAAVVEDKGEDASGVLGLEAAAAPEPVSMGTSSKLAVHTGASNGNTLSQTE